ncbi:MAG: RNA methyltransferase [Myxococcota bacterium]|jgi:TrmH family RNA methyltransferase|nr:RNA methyltransferase [Myxococcota bacterium]
MDNRLARFVVVLVEPQRAINLGTILRAMKNMGLSRLRMVRPAEMEFERSQISGHRTLDLLESAERFDSLESALADCNHAVAFSARIRGREWRGDSPRRRVPELFAAAQQGATVALVFGREQDGLSNDELERCDEVIRIPTRPDYSSLNLAQAVLLMGYELFLYANEGEEEPRPSPPAIAMQLPMQARHRLLAQIDFTLAAIGFYKSNAKEGVLHNLASIFSRAAISESEHRLLTGVFSEVLKFALLRRRGIPAPQIQVAQPPELAPELLVLLEELEQGT